MSVSAPRTVIAGYFGYARQIKIAGEPGVLLDKEFLDQNLPMFPPNAETASGLITEAV
jgi:hypothetical protein